MPLGQFQNQTQSTCTPPLLDQSLFTGPAGYTQGRYCGLGSFEDGTTCCFPCPIQDWLYPPEWQQQLRVPNYLSILSVILCCFLLLSFAVLPPEVTHRHYLSVGLLFPVLFITLSFAIPVTTNPSMCHDKITPDDMHGSSSCAWTGSFVALGGLGCVVWVFLRSLWLHIRIFWDKDPGKRFKWGSIIFGTVVPLIFLTVILVVTGFSYRMGQTCLPNHESAIVTFWVWLVVFAILAFLLQLVTTGYCFFVFVRTLQRERRESAMNSFQQQRTHDRLETWSNVRRLFLLQWRNILVSIFVIVGSISFFIVFWSQDSKLGMVFNDPENIKPVKTWIICQTLSRGDKEECRKYVQNFTVNQTAVLTSLILASLIGIEIFILLFRPSMITGWIAIFRGGVNYARRRGRPATPPLTSLENPEKYLPASPSRRRQFFSVFSPDTQKNAVSSSHTRDPTSGTTEFGMLETRPPFERLTSDAVLLEQPEQRYQSFWDTTSSTGNSRAATPLQTVDEQPNSRPSNHLSNRSLSQIQPGLSADHIPRSYTPMRQAPAPPSRASSVTSASINIKYSPSLIKPRTSGTPTVRGMISAPITESFVHIDGAFMARSGSRASERGGPLGLNPPMSVNAEDTNDIHMNSNTTPRYHSHSPSTRSTIPAETMPPKNVIKSRGTAEPGFAQSTYQYFTSKENRSVVTAVGMFAVRLTF
ncbi:unnamed protein product [Periconia digitata]|uniref:G-protein coupled receptors family 2 profile 2 domain-containing protein n=1 Tax=Periconia digitata TaxID=1303443 RepID=A0A9W4XW57_9PLEO|nr:unnamed protein product [Periconia digitata]